MNENNFNVDGFLRTLEQNQSKPKELGPTLRSLEKIYLSYPGNYGKYQIFPMNSVVTGYPFVILKDTREIKITKKNVLPDGTENVFDAWIKILPVDAYQMLDSTGRVVSSLTADDENLLIQASGVFDQLYEELGGNQKDQKLNKAISLLRRRNYTIFHGKCLSNITEKKNELLEPYGKIVLNYGIVLQLIPEKHETQINQQILPVQKRLKLETISIPG